LHPISVARLCDTVMVLLRQEAAQHRVRMSCDVDEDVGAVIAQRTQIEQVILNLARNAIEAMADRPGERRLRLSAQAVPAEEPPAPDGAVRPDRGVVIAVEDTGPGVSDAVRERLFEPFVTTKPEGLGLGLSISAGIIAKHGSRLCLAQPQQGRGARFEFTLPAATAGTGAPDRGEEEETTR
jgi:signal transduction histidine kinase